MPIIFIKYLKKARTLFLNMIGWCSLLFLWYKFMFGYKGIHSTITAFIAISLWAIILLIFCYLWNNLNFKNLILHSELSSNFIHIKVKEWTWSEIIFDSNNNIVDKKERFINICNQKENDLSSSKRHSYSAILIRDGYIIEAIGFLRQMLNDPYIGQLARKIAESELNLIFEDGNVINNVMECSVMDEINNNIEKQFHMSIFGYNKKQVEEYLNELMTYCWNLEEENKDLQTDLTSNNKKTQYKNSSNISNAKWEEKEFSMLLGLTLQHDILNNNGDVICKKNTFISTQLIESLITKGLYGELVAAADPSKGVERFAR